MKQKQVRTLADLVHGKSVALVGNSERIIRDAPGKFIDAADVVIRINRGLPNLIGTDAIGSRTDVWCVARYWPDCLPIKDLKKVVWMKRTMLGKTEMPMMADHLKGSSGLSLIEWPQRLEEACHEFVGAPPSTGIRMLWWLRKISKARHVSCYGMDCWEVPSHWSGKMNTPNHEPELERRAMLELL